VISARPAHRPLVSEADFVAAQQVRAARGPAPRNGSPAVRTKSLSYTTRQPQPCTPVPAAPSKLLQEKQVNRGESSLPRGGKQQVKRPWRQHRLGRRFAMTGNRKVRRINVSEGGLHQKTRACWPSSLPLATLAVCGDRRRSRHQVVYRGQPTSAGPAACLVIQQCDGPHAIRRLAIARVVA
jgi:hypothetical protein